MKRPNLTRPGRFPAVLSAIRRGLFCLGTGGCFLLLAACSSSDKALTVMPDSSSNSAQTAPVTSETTPTSPLKDSSTTSSSSSSVEPVTPEQRVTVETSVPVADPVTENPENIYALAGARAIAMRANETDLRGLSDEALAEVLLEASEAAYEIEYPSVVMYLDVSQDDDMNIVVVTEDESQTVVGTAYVCVVDGTAVAQEDACTPASSN